MMAHGLEEPACSGWASNAVKVRKEDGTLRFCVDYRQLIRESARTPTPPTHGRVFGRFGVGRVVFYLRLTVGIPSGRIGFPRLRQDYICYPAGTFRFNVMPFGLFNASATFQRLMNVAMAGLDPMICLVYLYDIIVHSRNLSAHLDRLRLWIDCDSCSIAC